MKSQPKINRGLNETWNTLLTMPIIIGLIVSPEDCIMLSQTIPELIITAPQKFTFR
jgi:hypothetical protein